MPIIKSQRLFHPKNKQLTNNNLKVNLLEINWTQSIRGYSSNKRSKSTVISIDEDRKPISEEGFNFTLKQKQNHVVLNNHVLKRENSILSDFTHIEATDKLSLTNRSRSNKRNKKFINLSFKKSPQNKTVKDKYIQNFITTNESIFDKQNHSTRLTNNNPSLVSTRKEMNKTPLTEIKYDYIRSTMKKLKNLSEMKLVKKRNSSRLQTTNQQWNQIQHIIADTYQNQTQLFKENEIFTPQIIQIFDELDKNEYMQDQFNVGQPLNNKSKLTYSEQESQEKVQIQIQSNQNQYQTISLSQQHELKNKIPLINTKEDQKIQDFIGAQKLSYQQIHSLLLIFEHILYKVPDMIEKTISLCDKHQINNKTPIYLLFQYMYFNKKIIQRELCQSEINLIHRKQIYDFSEIIEHIKKDNLNNFQMLKKLHQQVQKNKNNPQFINKNVQQPKFNQINSGLIQQFDKLNRQFVSSNVKLIKKILKKISKNSKTNEKQFQIFLNYSSCFVNLSKVYCRIKSIVENKQIAICPLLQLSFINPINPCYKNTITTNDSMFLYKEWDFIETKYLQMKQEQFQRNFEIQKEHQIIQEAYHKIIRELKTIERVFTQSHK